MNEEIFDFDELKEVMEENNLKKLDEFKRFGYLTTSNFGGIIIKVNPTGECVFVQEIWDSGYKEIKECEIKYDEKCEWVDEVSAYFEYEGDKYYLNEFMRSVF